MDFRLRASSSTERQSLSLGQSLDPGARSLRYHSLFVPLAFANHLC
jgi:hypothetical protein